MSIFHHWTQGLDDRYGWNDPYLSSRTLSQPDCLTRQNGRNHRKDSTSPVLHGK